MKFNQVGVSTSWNVVPLERVDHLHNLLILEQGLIRGTVLFFDILLKVVLQVEVNWCLVFLLAIFGFLKLLDHLLLSGIHF